ncbi:MAG: cytochrome c [Candidatus Puniceispirillum sp.]|nr:cytochrome c [Candidatus Puniceispirillum sp.]
MKKRPIIIVTMLTAFSAAMPGILSAHDGATGIVKERMDNFKATQGHLKAIGGLMGNQDYAAIIEHAEEIKAWAVKMPEFFPEGSGGAPSAAKPRVWEDFDGFKAAAQAHATATQGIIDAANAEDMTALTAAFRATADSCGGCHKVFKK